MYYSIDNHRRVGGFLILAAVMLIGSAMSSDDRQYLLAYMGCMVLALTLNMVRKGIGWRQLGLITAPITAGMILFGPIAEHLIRDV